MNNNQIYILQSPRKNKNNQDNTELFTEQELKEELQNKLNSSNSNINELLKKFKEKYSKENIWILDFHGPIPDKELKKGIYYRKSNKHILYGQKALLEYLMPDQHKKFNALTEAVISDCKLHQDNPEQYSPDDLIIKLDIKNNRTVYYEPMVLNNELTWKEIKKPKFDWSILDRKEK